MCAALSDCDPLDRCSAARAGFSGPLINFELILKMPARISPVKTGTVLFDGMEKRLPDGSVQPPAFIHAQTAPGTGRQNARIEQRFIRIDIPDSRNEILIQQNCLDHPMLP